MQHAPDVDVIGMLNVKNQVWETSQRPENLASARTNYELTDLDALLADFERDVTKGGTDNESHHRSRQQRDRIQGRAGTTRAESAWPNPGLPPFLRVSMGPASVYALAKSAGRNYSMPMPMLPASSNWG
jgi:hypothetical protein